MAFISLDSVINDYISESEQSISKYFKLWHIAFRGMENLGLDFFYQIKSVKLPINANLTVTLPADYLNYSKVGVLNNRGEIIPLNYNSKLTTYADLLPDRISKTQDNTVFNWSEPVNNGWFYNYWNNGYYSTLYGMPSGAPFVGSFKVDAHNGVIILDENFTFEYLMLEYLCSPMEGNDYYLPVHFREALVAWLAWMDIRNMPNTRKGSLGDKRDRRSEFYNQRRLAIAQYSPFRIEEAYAASQEQTRLTVKG